MLLNAITAQHITAYSSVMINGLAVALGLPFWLQPCTEFLASDHLQALDLRDHLTLLVEI